MISLRKKTSIRFSPVSSEMPSQSAVILESNGQVSIHAGWYLIRIPFSEKISDPHIILNLGCGFEDTYKYPINCINSRILDSVVALPSNIKKIRLTYNGETVPDIHTRLIPITRMEAFFRVGIHLYRLNKLRGISTTQILGEKIHQIKKAGILNIFKNIDEFYDYSDTSRPIGYHQWIEKNEDYSPYYTETSAIPCPNQPPKTILAYTCLTKNADIRRTIASLKKQVFQEWQLLIICENSVSQFPENDLSPELPDPRIKVIDSSTENALPKIMECFAQQKCDYVMQLYAGDTLSPMAFYFFVEVTHQHKGAILCYCDSDTIDKKGERIRPHFRPQWNRELFYSQNYISNCGIMRSDALEIGKNNLSIDDFTLEKTALKAIESGSEDKIIHIPKVLYHKNYLNTEKEIHSSLSRKNIIHAHCKRMGRDCRVETGLLKNTLKIIYPLPKNPPTVTLIIPTCDGLAILKKCIYSILSLTRYPCYKIIIVDNNSRDPKTHAYFEEITFHPAIRVIKYTRPFNFATINNFAVHQTESEFICLLNNDIEVFSEKWLEEMVRSGCRDEIGCVGAKLLYSNGKIQHAGIICGLGNVAGHAHRYFHQNHPGYFGRLQSAQYYSAITAACMLVRKSVYLGVGGMTETLAVAYNDVDFCLKLSKAGYKIVYTPYAALYHHESLSRGPEDTPEKKERYQREVSYMWATWKHELENDPCYSPNLSRLREDFSL